MPARGSIWRNPGFLIAAFFFLLLLWENATFILSPYVQGLSTHPILDGLVALLCLSFRYPMVVVSLGLVGMCVWMIYEAGR